MLTCVCTICCGACLLVVTGCYYRKLQVVARALFPVEARGSIDTVNV